MTFNLEVQIMKANDFKQLRKEMRIRFNDTILNTIAWLPVFILGLLCFYLATGVNPEGTLLDFRIKMLMAIGKSFMAVYVGEIL